MTHPRLGHALLKIGLAVRAHLLATRRAPEEMARAVGFEGGDVVFAIDRAVEPVIVEALAAWPDELLPVALTAEGMGPDGRRIIGPAGRPIRWHVMIDPIDGTRNLMYDKRAAWFLATVAPAEDGPPSLARCVAAAMVELPTSKQGEADHFVAETDGALAAMRVELATGRGRPLGIGGSRETTLLHGFGQVSSFFPGSHRLAADLMEAIAAAAAPHAPGGAAVFNDQYISSGGQMVELIMGRDRFCCDLRPLFHRIEEHARPGAGHRQLLACHPYDLAGLLLAKRAGICVTDAFGRDLDAPFDVHADVHWCGYANQDLRRLIEPVIQHWLAQRGLQP